MAWLAWLALHLVYLLGVRNKVSVFVNWAWNYLTWDRGPRLIINPPRREPADAAELLARRRPGLPARLTPHLFWCTPSRPGATTRTRSGPLSPMVQMTMGTSRSG